MTLRWALRRLEGMLWVRPLQYGIVATILVWAGGLTDLTPLGDVVPEVTADLVLALLSVLTASMFGVATFAVASMVSAYASVSNQATPRVFDLLIADDVSKTALSAFVATFVFGTIGVIAIKIQFYGVGGRFTLFVLTLMVYFWVLWTFLRWVDSIARLGRLATAIGRVEEALCEAFCSRAAEPTLRAAPLRSDFPTDRPVMADRVGYVQDLNLSALQDAAEAIDGEIQIAAAPGTFVGPGVVLAYVRGPDLDPQTVRDAFQVDVRRTFAFDPEHGFIVLSEIASRALSPAVNDPGTAIEVLGAMARAWAAFGEATRASEPQDDPVYDRVRLAPLDLEGLCGHAFGAIARDGAGMVEVGHRLQVALGMVACVGVPEAARGARQQSERALARAREAMTLDADIARLEAAAASI